MRNYKFTHATSQSFFMPTFPIWVHTANRSYTLCRLQVEKRFNCGFPERSQLESAHISENRRAKGNSLALSPLPIDFLQTYWKGFFPPGLYMAWTLWVLQLKWPVQCGKVKLSLSLCLWSCHSSCLVFFFFVLPTSSNTVEDGKGVRKIFLFSYTCASVPIILCAIPLKGKETQERQTSVDNSKERRQYKILSSFKFFNIKWRLP